MEGRVQGTQPLAILLMSDALATHADSFWGPFDAFGQMPHPKSFCMNSTDD